MADDTPVSVAAQSKAANPIHNMIGLLSTVAVSTWAYFGVIERLNFIEMKLESHWEEIEENDNWIDDFSPPASVQDSVERVRNMEIRMAEMEMRLRFLERNK